MTPALLPGLIVWVLDRTAEQSLKGLCMVAQDCEAWDEVSAATGWSLAECLTHRLAFKKKDDPKVGYRSTG